ncbi:MULTISPECIES: helix-turn-helix transcriptional regulator [Bacillus]|uniref:Transcriptional regulator n=2 Tax=Bacillus TaxID=1386 RepID=A0AAJ4D4R9_9BACI|nr:MULTISPECIES: helix-turn-helix transcriptional regulator [Bacillus]KKB73958.1 DNA-binding protein [Bacillus sp. TH008]MDU0072476.1 helix-turn-helix transcriptional regulator [Bacillus sp. IG6]MED8020324.1 helix-turn-helix transcriptional regulator [Bacillus glycinifermentans]QAT67482.1 transcriptional regulator [Bacillus glycinifermentans]WKB77133.1 helix-turn-helix transcriptional regulator [Bacillus glycinifermentans]
MENRLVEFRKKYNYSQETLAVKLNVSRQTIISIEKGKYNPSLRLAMLMAKLFETSVEELFILDSEDV